MTLAELERWALERGLGTSRKLELAQHLTHYTVLPVSRELCLTWAEVALGAKRRGRPIQTADAWIAASALYYQVPLITNNRSDQKVFEVRRFSELAPPHLFQRRPRAYDGLNRRSPSGQSYEKTPDREV